MTSREKKALQLQFGVLLRDTRRRKNLTVREVSYHCNLDHSKISKIEQGRINITLATLVELAAGLSVHPSELLQGPLNEIAPVAPS